MFALEIHATVHFCTMRQFPSAFCLHLFEWLRDEQVLLGAFRLGESGCCFPQAIGSLAPIGLFSQGWLHLH